MITVAPENRALYHAALCVMSNYLVALADLGSGLLAHSGMDRAEALAAAEPLIRGTVENIGSVGVPDALTGPIARGDIATVARHLQALDAIDKKTGDTYRALGVYTVDIARRKGRLQARDARKLIRLLQPTRRGKNT